MDGPFICSYSDILYRPSVISGLLASRDDMTLSIDTKWLNRYGERTEHPLDDAEKATVAGGVVTRVDRRIAEGEAYGEFTGVAKFSEAGAVRLKQCYH